MCAVSTSTPLATSPEGLPTFISALNERQREAVLTTEGPLIVLAGAGSGKTKMLTSRIAYLIDGRRVPCHQILAMTFTNKAAAEMRERVTHHLRESFFMGAPEIGTFHSICVRILRREAHCTPFTKPFVIYDDADQLSLIKSIVNKLGIDDKTFNPKGIQGRINRVKCDAKEPQDLQPALHDIYDRQLKRVYEQYQKDLFANNALDFGEIICMTYRLFRDQPEIRKKYQQRFRYIHVDEYQDTNRAQYLLLSMLADLRNDGHQNICVVGDEDQSIYKWRGADIRNILDFEQDYPGSRVVKLEQNYRSTKTIIAAASQIIKNNRERKDKTLWTDNEEGRPIIRMQLPDERAEAEMVISELKRLAASEGHAYKDFAVFYRTHAQSRQFEDVLRREKVSYQIVGGLRFYDRKEIKDILSYFKVILNPSDSVSLKRIINVPARGIGKTTLDKLEELQVRIELSGESDATLWGALKRASLDSSITSAGTMRKLTQFVAFVERLITEQPKLKVSELYHLILDETGYVRGLKQEGTPESLARVENLEEFDTLLQKEELLPLFLEQSALATEVDQQGAEANISAVNLMTLHSSKGLEFPVVFLVGMEEGLFPSVRPWEETDDEEIEEERRLCYVGMTRARELLYLSNVSVRRIWGNINYQEPARFFTEIPEGLVDFKDLTYGAGARSYRTGSSRQFEKTPVREEFSQLLPPFNDDLIGRKMRHDDYGMGTVLSSEGTGTDQKVTVEFKGRERRKFLLRYIKDRLV
jgi:DNA helicase II / ATP-dependent DNA helicase PcrA